MKVFNAWEVSSNQFMNTLLDHQHHIRRSSRRATAPQQYHDTFERWWNVWIPCCPDLWPRYCWLVAIYCRCWSSCTRRMSVWITVTALTVNVNSKTWSPGALQVEKGQHSWRIRTWTSVAPFISSCVPLYQKEFKNKDQWVHRRERNVKCIYGREEKRREEKRREEKRREECKKHSDTSAVKQ